MSKSKIVRPSTAIADPDTPANVLKPNADGSINVVGGGSSSTPSIVGGTVAGGVAATGNPVPAGANYNATLPTYADGQRTQVQSDTRGNLRSLLVAVTAASADNLTNSIGFITSFSSAAATALFGTAGHLFGATQWARARDILGSFGAGTGVAAVEMSGAPYVNITTGTTTTAKSGAGILHKVIINTPVLSATITIYDNTAGSGTKIATLTIGSVITGDLPVSIAYDLAFATGLTLVTSGATDVTVVYR